jgi:hypothetical protein
LRDAKVINISHFPKFSDPSGDFFS